MTENTNLSHCNKALSRISQETNTDSNETHNPEQIINWLSIPMQTKNIEIIPILINDFGQDTSSQALPLTSSPERTNEDSNETHNPEQILDWPTQLETRNIEIVPMLINDFGQETSSQALPLTASSERGTTR